MLENWTIQRYVTENVNEGNTFVEREFTKMYLTRTN